MPLSQLNEENAVIDPNGSIAIFKTEDGHSHVEVHVIDETVWLPQAQMCELFDKNKRTVSEHIRNIFKEGELQEQAVVRNFRTTAAVMVN